MKLSKVREWFQESILEPASHMEISDILQCVAIGLWGGVFPIPGITTFATIALLFCSPFRVNGTMKAFSLAVNMLATPIQFAMMPLFLQLGNMLMPNMLCEPSVLMSKFRDSESSLIVSLGESSTCLSAAIFAWAAFGLTAVAVGYLMVILYCQIFKRPTKSSEQRRAL
mmetsp:Transcript_24808/g.36589  ORF Transcript_24808/g.36589 Transcript_24808/m.36589 type:complete len:169 (+) Transcript_24808:34-540(+)